MTGTESKTNPAQGPAWLFAGFRFQPQAAQLVRGGKASHLPPKEAALLALLLEHHGQVVGHREIWRSIWPGQDVSYESLTRCIYSLRRLLGDEHAGLVVTVPRRGYTIGVPVKYVAAPPRRVSSVIEKSIRTSPAAHATYQQGLYEARLPGLANQRRAMELFQRAHAIDPGYAVPLGAIAECCLLQSLRGFMAPRKAAEIAGTTATKALRLDPELVSPIAVVGWFDAIVHGRTDKAMAGLDHALDLDADHAMAHYCRGWVLRALGHLAEAATSFRTALALDPFLMSAYHHLAWTLVCDGQAEEALEMERRFIREHPQIDTGHFHFANIAAWLNRHEDAVAAAQKSVRLSHQDPFALAALGYARARAGYPDEARQLLAQALASKRPGVFLPFVAAASLELGETRQALAQLQQAHELRSPWFGCALLDPRLAALRHEPAFIALARQTPAKV